MVIGYLLGKHGYCNIPYNSIHSVSPSNLDAEEFTSCSASPSTVPITIAMLPPPQLQIAPATQNPTHAHSQDPSVTQHLTISEKIEANKLHLAKV